MNVPGKKLFGVLSVGALAAGLAVSGVLAGEPQAPAGPKAVVELFTSQGCSSCPPADALLGELAARPDLVALTFNVDYWDYLGWPDTLASHENTERQRGYAQARGDRQVYTPQMVVNGGDHFVGGDRSAIEGAIADSGAADSLPVAVTLGMTDEAVTIGVDGTSAGGANRGTVWLIAFDRERTVPIGRGENSGRTITYHNVVKKMQRLAMWKGKPLSIDVPLVTVSELKADGCAVLLQTETRSGLPGPVLGAAITRHHAAK